MPTTSTNDERHREAFTAKVDMKLNSKYESQTLGVDFKGDN
jgi:hypothetical protein